MRSVAPWERVGVSAPLRVQLVGVVCVGLAVVSVLVVAGVAGWLFANAVLLWV